MERAYVTQILDSHHVVVRIPTLNKISKAAGATPDDELSVAIVAAPPGTHPEFMNGDAVLVEFENEDFNRPVIVGSLFNQKTKNQRNVFKINYLEVVDKTTLPTDTAIGKVTKDELQLLEGLNLSDNRTLQEWVIDTDGTLSGHQSSIEKNSENIQKNVEKINATRKDIGTYADTLHGTATDLALTFDTADVFVKSGRVKNLVLNPKLEDGTDPTSFVTVPPYTLHGIANSLHNVMVKLNKDLDDAVTWVDGELSKAKKHTHVVSDIKNILIKSNAEIKGEPDGELLDRIKDDPNLKKTSDGAILFVY